MGHTNKNKRPKNKTQLIKKNGTKRHNTRNRKNKK
jgi:hypothetical protein